MSVWNIGVYNIGWMPGAWRCDFVMYPLWEAEDKVYSWFFQDDWKPWFPSEKEKEDAAA